MSKQAISFLIIFFYGQVSTAEILLFEDFENPITTYTTNITEASDTDLDYFGRIAPNGLSISSVVEFDNQQGEGYFAAMDTDALPEAADEGILTFIVDITGFVDLQFSGLFAEDDASDALEDWDASTSFLARYSIDGGTAQNLLAFESSGATNTEPSQDMDFDGIGDGFNLTNIFTQYTLDINGTGAQLTLELVLNNFDASDEDIAFDNITISGNAISTPVPIPAAFWLLLCALVGLRRVQSKAI